MHDASRRLHDCLADMYEPDWFGKEEMDAVAEVRQAAAPLRCHQQELDSTHMLMSNSSAAS